MTTLIDLYEKDRESNPSNTRFYLTHFFIEDIIPEARVIKNGFYIPFLHIFLFAYTQNLFLSSIIVFKLYPANYYFWFYPLYNYNGLPSWISFFKQFVRFTDSGHLASLLYFYNPAFFSITYNVHFTITFGYWIGRLLFDLKDADYRHNSEIYFPFIEWWSACNHLCPLLLMIRELWINQENLCKNDLFTIYDFYYSFLWGYFWLMMIYLPWRIVTQDCLYSVLSNKVPVFIQGIFLFIMHLLFYISNMSGSLMTSYICE